MKVKLFVIFCLFSTLSIAWAKPPGNQQQGHRPPPEALSACDSKSDGDVCSFTTPHGDTVSGKCIKKDNHCFCVPQGRPGSSGGGPSSQGGPSKEPPKEGMGGDDQQKRLPPPGATTAQNRRNNNGAAGFTAFDEDSISGKYAQKDNSSLSDTEGQPEESINDTERQGEPPKRPPRGSMQGGNHRRRPPPPEAISACDSKNNGDTCSFTTPDGKSISGKCVKKENQCFCVPQGRPGQSKKGSSAHGESPKGPPPKEATQKD